MSVYTQNEIADRVKPIAEAYGIDRVYLFGSYARGEADENSDVDLYVEFTRPMGLSFCGFYSEIEEKIGKKVDIITKNALLNPVTRPRNENLLSIIESEGIQIYG